MAHRGISHLDSLGVSGGGADLLYVSYQPILKPEDRLLSTWITEVAHSRVRYAFWRIYLNRTLQGR